MAFTSTKLGNMTWKSRNVTYGTWETDTTGGDIDTHLTICEGITLQHTGSSVVADQPSINETFPIRADDGGSVKVTIVCTSGKGGTWRAWGI